MTDPRRPVMFVVLLHKVGKLGGSPGLADRGLGVGGGDQLELAVTVATHLPLGVQTLAVSPDTVPALGTPDTQTLLKIPWTEERSSANLYVYLVLI